MRIAKLSATDEQYVAALPDPAVVAAASRPGLRFTEVLQAFVDGYASRPALGSRTRVLATEPETGRTTFQLKPHFDTITYEDLWQRVRAASTALRQDPAYAVQPGDFVVTVGFASPDYLAIDLICAYLGLVTVPVQHTAATAQLKPIIDEVQPRVIAVTAPYLERIAELVMDSPSTRHLLVFDYQPEADDHRETLERVRARLDEVGAPVTVQTLADIVAHGAGLEPEPAYTGGSDERLAMILYTSGSTGTPKGVMYTERMLTQFWVGPGFTMEPDVPVFNVNFMPLNHVAGRVPLLSAFRAGGTSYFVAEADLSTLLEDWELVRPTELHLVPRVVDMLFQHYRNAVDRRVSAGSEIGAAEAAAMIELREQGLGGRVLFGSVSSAPLSDAMREFIDSLLELHVGDGYGSTEIGAVSRDGRISRPPVIDYKLVDVPELGYFGSDRPHPRGELLVKSLSASPGYYKRPDITAEVFDADGYYHTGDVMAELAPDHLVYVDRSKNVLKLAQGEFVAVANLEAVFGAAQLVRQIFVYGNSEQSNVLAVIVPTPEALDEFGDGAALKGALNAVLRETAKAAELQSYEVPADFLIETEPFSAANGLLSGIGKIVRPKLKEHYGERLEQMYEDLAAARAAELRELRDAVTDRPTIDTVLRAVRTILGSVDSDIDPHDLFMDLGGDSLSALTFSTLLGDLFGIDVPVTVILNPAGSLKRIAEYVDDQRTSGAKRPTMVAVHGQDATELRASDLTLDKFIDAGTLERAKSLPHPTDEPKTVLLTGANGWLGRFLTLEWLERLSQTGGKLVTIVRGADTAAARARLERAFDGTDPLLLQRFRELSADHLEVVAGDVGEPGLGLDAINWTRLAEEVDLIVHAAALVNHVLPYDQLFGPNVVGAAELIRFAISTKLKPVTYLSTVAVSMGVDPDKFTEDGDIRVVSPVRQLGDSYANGYSNSKWAGEVLLSEAHDLCGLPVAVFRSDMILAHSTYTGQLNVPDSFTRLIFSLLATGVAPRTFYETDNPGERPRAHYAGLPVDFVAAAISTLGAGYTEGYHSFDVLNPYDDGISLDTFVDWLIDAGHTILRIDDYDQWLRRFETALRALPEKQSQQSILPLLHAYAVPQQAVPGASVPTEVFHAAVRAAKIGPDKDIPHLSSEFIEKYANDLKYLGLI